MGTDFVEFNRDIKSLNSIGNDVSAYLSCYNDGKRGEDKCDADTNKRSMNQIRQKINETRLTYTDAGLATDAVDLSTGINNYSNHENDIQNF